MQIKLIRLKFYSIFETLRSYSLISRKYVIMLLRQAHSERKLFIFFASREKVESCFGYKLIKHSDADQTIKQRFLITLFSRVKKKRRGIETLSKRDGRNDAIRKFYKTV